MKRYCLSAAFFVAAAAAFGLPKVAVFDAVVPAKMDKSVVVPVTEKVIERLVSSNRYLVLDRANVEKVLREREFQLTGMVSDAELSQAGKFLGAEFVVVIKVEQVGETYFISSKMIAVETSVIARQSSADGEGKLAVLIKLAERVGDVLAGSAPQAASASDKASPAASASEPSASAGAAPASPAAGAPAARARDARDDRIGFRTYLSLGSTGQDFKNEDTGVSASFNGAYFDLYLLGPIWNGLCFVASIASSNTKDDGGPELVFFDGGLGYALALGPVMPWVALRLGGASGTMNGKDVGGGIVAHFDLGADFRLGDLLLGLRVQGEGMNFKQVPYTDALQTFEMSGSGRQFLFMVGWRL